MTKETHKIGKRLFKLLNNEVIFGEVELVEGPNGSEVLIKTPFTAKNGNILPYMSDEIMSSPGAIQIHPMNILWSVPLDEFKLANEAYIKATTGLIF